MSRVLFSAMAALVAALWLSACGAGADVNDALFQAVLQDETASASTSEAGLMDYLMVLMFASSEAVDSAELNAMSPPGDDNLEP